MEENLVKSKNLKGIVDKIEKYVEFLNQNEDFITKYYDIGDGLSVSFRRANVK